MNFLRLLPVLLSFLLLAAHFLRAGLTPVVIMLLLCSALLLFRRPWVARLSQIILLLGSVEWIRTLVFLVNERRSVDQPWARLCGILGFVAVFTAASALVFTCKSLKRRYNLAISQVEETDNHRNNKASEATTKSAPSSAHEEPQGLTLGGNENGVLDFSQSLPGGSR